MLGLLHEIDVMEFRDAGIYLIELKVPPRSVNFSRWLQRFRADFNKPEHRQSWVPTPKEMRITAHTQLKPWMPIYVGKAQRVGARLKEHIHLRLDAKTTALKLVARELWEPYTFRVQMIPLTVRNYDLIAPRLEAAIRDHLNPLLGRQ
jgi:hypothetical protein